MEKLYHGMPPEKYYEACITYHLVRHYKLICDKELYPFSITQIRERELGFDFGYELSRGRVFLGQYKRPVMKRDGHYAWQINRAQLEALAEVPVPAFYILPAFSGVKEWYEGLEKSHFLPAGAVLLWMQSQEGKKDVLLHETDPLLQTVRALPFDAFGGRFHRAALAEPVMEEELMERIGRLQAGESEPVWGYWAKEEGREADDHFRRVF